MEGEVLCLLAGVVGVGPLPLLPEGEGVGAGHPCRQEVEGEGVGCPCSQVGAVVGAGVPCCCQAEVEVGPELHLGAEVGAVQGLETLPLLGEGLGRRQCLSQHGTQGCPCCLQQLREWRGPLGEGG